MSIEAGVEGIEVSKYGTGHHVGQLNAHAEMGWSDEKPLNQVAESRRTLPIADQEPMVKLPEPLIVVWSSMVADDDSVDPLPDRPLKILKVILKPLRKLLVGKPVKVVFTIDVRKLVRPRRMSDDTNEPDGTIPANRFVDGGPEQFLFFRIKVAEAVRLPSFRRSEVTPLDLSLDSESCFEAPQISGYLRPRVFWNDDAAKDEERRLGCPSRRGRRSRFIHKEDLHRCTCTREMKVPSHALP